MQHFQTRPTVLCPLMRSENNTQKLNANLFKVREKPRSKLDGRFFSRNREVISSGTYINQREVTSSALLSPGYYVIVPSAFYADKSGSFLVRIYTEKRIDLYELI